MSTVDYLLQLTIKGIDPNQYAMRSSKINLKSAKFNFHFSDWSYTLLAKLPFTTDKSVNWFQRYGQLKGCKNNRKKSSALFGYILKSVFTSSNPFWKRCALGVFINTLVGWAGQLKIFAIKLFWPPLSKLPKLFEPPSASVKNFFDPSPLLDV